MYGYAPYIYFTHALRFSISATEKTFKLVHIWSIFEVFSFYTLCRSFSLKCLGIKQQRSKLAAIFVYFIKELLKSLLSWENNMAAVTSHDKIIIK